MSAQDYKVRIDYTNWRGERRWRVIRPIRIVFISNECHSHSERQWLLIAHDDDDLPWKTKMFAMANIHEWKPL